MSSTEYQDDPWGRHWCQAPRRNGFLIETGKGPKPGMLHLFLQCLEAIVRGTPPSPPDRRNRSP